MRPKWWSWRTQRGQQSLCEEFQQVPLNAAFKRPSDADAVVVVVVMMMMMIIMAFFYNKTKTLTNLII